MARFRFGRGAWLGLASAIDDGGRGIAVGRAGSRLGGHGAPGHMTINQHGVDRLMVPVQSGPGPPRLATGRAL